MSIVGNQSSNGDDLFAIVQLLANPQKLKEEHDRLNAIREQAESLFKLIGPAQEVIRLRDEAKADRDKAADAVARARGDAARIIEEAKKHASIIEQQAHDSARKGRDTVEALVEEAKKRRDQLAEHEQELALKSATLESAKREIDALRASLEEEIVKARDQEALFAERRDSLKKLAVDFAETLRGLGDR